MNSPNCHPERKHKAKGLCKSCYNTSVINVDKAKQYRKDYYLSNTQLIKDRADTFNKKNPDKHRESIARWSKAHPEKKAATEAKRRATKLNATPSWLTKTQLQEIAEFYTLAQELQWLSEEPLQVDHIVPLQGKDVCGLHVPWNLQILPRSLNCSKSNKKVG